MPRRALTTLTIVLAFGCALGLAHVACVIALHVPFDPNEGWNAYFAQAAMQAGSPYPAAQSLMINNYPPLSFYAVGAVATLTGDAIVAGRLVALAALLGVAWGVESAARRMGCGRMEALFAALLFTSAILLTSDYAGMDDPQMLAHAVAMGGLVLALREPRSPRLMAAAAALFALAFFIKHNLVVLPAALTLWLALADRRRAIVFAASLLIFLLVGLGLFRDAFGVTLFHQIASARLFSLANVWAGLTPWLPWSVVPLAGAAALALVARRDAHAVFCVLYAGAATAAGAFFLGGAGVDANALFDADIALGLSAGVLLSRLQNWQGIAAALYAVPLAVCVWMLDVPWTAGAFWLAPMAQEQRAAADEIAFLRAAKGPALCEMLSLCYWAGKPAEVDVFNIGQAYATGARRDTGLAQAVAARHFAVLQFEKGEAFPLGKGVQGALTSHYRIARDDEDRVFYTPVP